MHLSVICFQSPCPPAPAHVSLCQSLLPTLLTMRRAVAPLLFFPAALVAGASINFNLGKDHGDDGDRQINVPFLNGFYNPNGGNAIEIVTDLYVSKSLFCKVLAILVFFPIYRILWRPHVVSWWFRARLASSPCSMCVRSPCRPCAGRAARRRTNGSPEGG